MKARHLGVVLAVLALTSVAWGQEVHNHALQVHGVPGGVPDFCGQPTVTSVAGGAWSDPATWSTRKVPAADDRVAISARQDVVYDVVSDAKLACVEIRGRLRFRADANTRMKTANLMVMDEGYLEVGSAGVPVAPNVTAEIIIADQKIDRQLDPAELGAGIESLGKIAMHGALKSPTFVRLAEEPLAGQTTLTLEQSVKGWKAGDRISIPDTRQLRESERGSNYKPQDEKLEIASIAENKITLSTPLKYDHKGARNAENKLEFLPHIGNLSRNVIVRSENPAGTRGHMIFMSRSDIDLRFVEVRDMGRTRMGVLDNTEFDDQGQVRRLGVNQIGRYAIHFHHYFGPKQTPADGYQFTLIGNAVDGAPKWGVTVHNSHYGLVQDNVVYNTHGAGIVTEDGTESFNVFEHNFAMRSEGSGDFAPRSGYSGAGPDPGGEGGGFWFRGPNNYIRNNVAANADVFGFQLAAGSLDSVRIPAFKGADMASDRETVAIDTTDAKVLEFANNEAYGAIQTGVAFGWNGEIKNFRAWNPSRHGLTVTPTDKLTVDAITVRGDKSILSDAEERPAGIWVGNYLAKSVAIRNADIQGMRAGVASPFFHSNQSSEPGRGDGTIAIENSYFRDYVGIVVATAYQPKPANARPAKTAIVRNSVFEPLDVPAHPGIPPAAISMNYNMAPDDAEPRVPINVFDFNKKAGDNFRVFYSLHAPRSVAPCNDSRPALDGWVCK
ncbi:MAG TPA: G8 domain-containing protein [Terriglobia bacterium]|nr:G8 domain-containing protein [Terriglobia bacterium]